MSNKYKCVLWYHYLMVSSSIVVVVYYCHYWNFSFNQWSHGFDRLDHTIIMSSTIPSSELLYPLSIFWSCGTWSGKIPQMSDLNYWGGSGVARFLDCECVREKMCGDLSESDNVGRRKSHSWLYVMAWHKQ